MDTSNEDQFKTAACLEPATERLSGTVGEDDRSGVLPGELTSEQCVMVDGHPRLIRWFIVHQQLHIIMLIRRPASRYNGAIHC